MSFLDRIAAAVTPAASDETRAEARRKAEAIASSEDWLALILQQHREIEGLLTAALAAEGTDARLRAIRELEMILTGHATAEEAVIYPDVSEYSGKTHASMAYEEHAMTKVQLAKLEKMDPESPEWREKLLHIQGALQQHMYEEEGTWLPNLAEEMPPAEKRRMTQRFIEEFERYCGKETASSGARTAPAGLQAGR